MINTFLKCGKFQSFGNGSNKWKLYSLTMKSRLNSGKAWYHSVQNRLPSHPLSNNEKTKYKITNFMGVKLYLSPYRKNTDLVCMRTGCWRQEFTGGWSCLMRSVINL